MIFEGARITNEELISELLGKLLQGAFETSSRDVNVAIAIPVEIGPGHPMTIAKGQGKPVSGGMNSLGADEDRLEIDC